MSALCQKRTFAAQQNIAPGRICSFIVADTNILVITCWRKPGTVALAVSYLKRAKERIQPMTETVTELCDEKVLNDELPDAALEIAGSKSGEGAAASVTAAFCSGLDSCPSSPPK